MIAEFDANSAIEATKGAIWLVRWLHDHIVPLLEKHAFFYGPETRHLQEELFPTLFHDLSSDVGKAHEKYPHMVHPDNRVAAVEISKSLSTIFSRGRKLMRFVNVREPERDRNLILIGSAKSNLLTREAMGYQRDSEKLGLEPRTSLRFTFDFDEAHLYPCRRRVAGELHTVPNYKLLDREKGKEYVPRTDDDGYLVEDFLLLTVEPNILSRYENKVIVNPSGIHGIGTRAFALLLRNRELLKLINEERKGNRYFQSVIRVAKIRQGRQYFTPERLEHVLTVPIESKIF